MFWDTGETEEATARAAARYDFAVPMVIELSNGLFRSTDQVDAFLVDLSASGAGILCHHDERLKERRRYRVHIDDHAGIIEVRNVVPVAEHQLRIGVEFKGLGLELQELVADSIDSARADKSRLTQTNP